MAPRWAPRWTICALRAGAGPGTQSRMGSLHFCMLMHHALSQRMAVKAAVSSAELTTKPAEVTGQRAGGGRQRLGESRSTDLGSPAPRRCGAPWFSPRPRAAVTSIEAPRPFANGLISPLRPLGAGKLLGRRQRRRPAMVVRGARARGSRHGRPWGSGARQRHRGACDVSAPSGHRLRREPWGGEGRGTAR